MKTFEFCRNNDADDNYFKWAFFISDDMADVWDAMIEHGKHEWLIWTANVPGVLPDSVLRKLACRFVRETPLADGRKVWDLLIDERSRMAIEVAERYADGKATEKELIAAGQAAYAAYDACSGDYDTTWAAYAAWAACRGYNVNVSSVDDADAALARIVAELGNPFRKEMVK